jgi:hypothetical protein
MYCNQTVAFGHDFGLCVGNLHLHINQLLYMVAMCAKREERM